MNPFRALVDSIQESIVMNAYMAEAFLTLPKRYL